jgi:hypothetical protein
MHQVWVDRGRAFLRGRPVDVPLDFVKRDDMCPIGSWLRDRIDPRLKTLPLFDRTNASHNQFHVALERLFKAEPGSLVARNEFRRTGDELTALIEEWIVFARAS